MTPPDRTFFSYAREDSEFALALAKALRSAGATIWLDQLDIVPGQRWDRAVEDALHSCPRLLVVLSPASVDSSNVMDEVSLALEEQKTVIPVVYLDCKIPFRLRRLQHVDFRPDYERGLSQLLATFGLTRQGPPAAVGPVAASPAATIDRGPAQTGSDRQAAPIRPEPHDPVVTPGDSALDAAAAEDTDTGVLRRALIGALAAGLLWAPIPRLVLFVLTFINSAIDVDNSLAITGGLLNGLVLALVFLWLDSRFPKKPLAFVVAVWPLVFGVVSLMGPDGSPLNFWTWGMWVGSIRLRLAMGFVAAGMMTGGLAAWAFERSLLVAMCVGAAAFGAAPLMASIGDDGPGVWAITATYFMSGGLGAGALLWFVFPAPPSTE